MSEILEILEKAKKVKPLGTIGGKTIVSFEDATILAQAEAINKTDLGTRNVNANGTIASSKASVVAVNPERFYCGRYKLIGTGAKKKIVLVRDYRACSEWEKGSIYKANLPAFVLSRDEDGKLTCEKMIQVSDDDFITNFKGTIDYEGMAEILPLLNMSVQEADSLPI